MKKIILISGALLLLDQMTKLLITSILEINSSIKLIGSFFSLTHVRNYGAAFSILEGNRLFLVGVAIFTLAIIYNLFIKNNNLTKFEVYTYSLLIGGIMGNLIDRMIHGYVIDFLDFNILKYNFPVFNFADVFIVISVFLIIVTTIGEKDEKNNS